MKVKIAIPEHPFYKALVERADEVKKNFDVEMYPVSEKQCGELLLNNRVDIALLSPLGYGMAVAKANYRIIPGPAINLYAYTETASIYFAENAQNMESCATNMEENFLLNAAKIILNEKYGFDPEILFKKGSVDELLKEAEIAVAWGTEEKISAALDISEDWFDTFEMPLPLAFWTFRNDDEDLVPDNLKEIVQAFAKENLPEEEKIQERDKEGTAVEGRIGKIDWRWTDESEEALNATLQLLYFHQHIPEIPAVKILGRD